eukprot:gene9970-biopygen1618
MRICPTPPHLPPPPTAPLPNLSPYTLSHSPSYASGVTQLTCYTRWWLRRYIVVSCNVMSSCNGYPPAPVPAPKVLYLLYRMCTAAAYAKPAAPLPQTALLHHRPPQPCLLCQDLPQPPSATSTCLCLSHT